MIRAVFWTVAAAYAGVVAVSAWRLPPRVPTHFGASGGPDQWGTRTEMVLIQAGLGVAMVLLFVGCSYAVRRVSATRLNLPHKQWWTATDERMGEARRRAAGDLYALGALTLAFLAGIWILLLTVVEEPDPRLGVGAWILMGCYVAAVVGACLIIATLRYRPSED